MYARALFKVRARLFDSLSTIEHLSCSGQPPVAFKLERATVAFYRQEVSRWKAPHARDYRARFLHRTKRKIRVERGCVDATLHEAGREQPAKLRAKQDPRALLAIVERLYSEPISRDEYTARVVVANRKCKHPSQKIDAALSISRIELEQHFGVAVGSKSASLGG